MLLMGSTIGMFGSSSETAAGVSYSIAASYRTRPASSQGWMQTGAVGGPAANRSSQSLGDGVMWTMSVWFNVGANCYVSDENQAIYFAENPANYGVGALTLGADQNSGENRYQLGFKSNPVGSSWGFFTHARFDGTGMVTDGVHHNAATASITSHLLIYKGFKLLNGRQVKRLGIKKTQGSDPAKLFVCKRNSSSEYELVAGVTGTHEGNSQLHYFSLTTPYIIPDSGDYYMGASVDYGNSVSDSVTPSGHNRAYKSLSSDGSVGDTVTSMSEGTGNCWAMGVEYDSLWHHLVLQFDSGQSTESNRTKIYIDNNLQDGEETGSGIINQDTNSYVLRSDTSVPQQIGSAAPDANSYTAYSADIHLADFIIMDHEHDHPSANNTVMAPTEFGELDVNGIWSPKDPDDFTFAGNSFWLKFADNGGTNAANLGTDSSGLGNHWTVNNSSTANQYFETPTTFAEYGGFVSSAFATADSSDSSPAYTFSDMSLGAASFNKIVVCVTWNASSGVSVSSVTVDGDAMTLAKASADGNPGASIFYRDSVSATDGDIIVTFSGATVNRVGIGVFALKGFATGDPADDATASSTGNPSVTIDCAEGGVVIGVHSCQSTGTWNGGHVNTNWEGLKKLYDESTESGQHYQSGAMGVFPAAVSSHTVTVTDDLSGAEELTCVAWNAA